MRPVFLFPAPTLNFSHQKLKATSSDGNALTYIALRFRLRCWIAAVVQNSTNEIRDHRPTEVPPEKSFDKIQAQG
jgi:hypothetical protein